MGNAPKSTNKYRPRLEHLPHAEENSPLGSKAALAAFFILRDTNPHLHTAIKDQARISEAELLRSLEALQDPDGYYHLSPGVLRSIISRCTINGAAQAAVGIGGALKEISLLNDYVGQGEVVHPLGDNETSDDARGDDDAS